MRKPFSILNEQAANFSPVKASLESEFSMIDWRYDMIDFAAPWDKQSILCLTNSRCYLLKETTYIEVKYLLEGLSKVLCYGIPYTLLHWVAHYSLRITIFLYWSVQANRSIWGGASTMAGAVYTGSHTLQHSSRGQPHSEVQCPPFTMARTLFPSITILLSVSLCLKCLFSCFLLSSSHLSFRDKLQTALNSHSWSLLPQWLDSSPPLNSSFYYLVSLRTKSCDRARRKRSSEAGSRKGES